VPVKVRAVLKLAAKDNKLVARLSKAVLRASKVKLSRVALKVPVRLRASKVVLLRALPLKAALLKVELLKVELLKAVPLRVELPKVALLGVLVLVVLPRVNKARAKVVRVVKAKADLRLSSHRIITTVLSTVGRTICSFPFLVNLRMAHGQLMCRCSGLDDSGVDCRVAMTFTCISFLFARLIP
jgi:hypothetical protein